MLFRSRLGGDGGVPLLEGQRSVGTADATGAQPVGGTAVDRRSDVVTERPDDMRGKCVVDDDVTVALERCSHRHNVDRRHDPARSEGLEPPTF